MRSEDVIFLRVLTLSRRVPMGAREHTQWL